MYSKYPQSGGFYVIVYFARPRFRLSSHLRKYTTQVTEEVGIVGYVKLL